MVNEKNDEFIVVGLGASAGGLEALRQTIPTLPTDENIVYVIIQHMDPYHQSMLVSLLSPSSSMDVLEVKDNMVIQPNKIYITPSGYDITFGNKKLYLHKTGSTIGPKPSIDRFFVSLASQDVKSVGIILSGTGSDGAHGMRAIKASGGITIVQSPGTAKYDGMPNAASETGSVDLILPPEKIGEELLSFIQNLLLISDTTPMQTAPDDMGKLIALVRKHTGFDFSEYKENTINRRIKRRIALHKLQSLKYYVKYAEENPKELEELVKDILISVTSFFRDREAFEELAKVIPDLIKGKKDDQPIRGWIPGCASGEEVYSLVILFSEYFGGELSTSDVVFYATDVDTETINRARKGIYPAASIEDLDQKIIDTYFIKENNSYRVKKTIRDLIVFAKQDIISDPPFSRLDLIACRNLLIYFKSSLQYRLITMFHYILNDRGILFLGKSESVSHCFELFDSVSKKWRIFRRKQSFTRTKMIPQNKKLMVYQLMHKRNSQQKKPELSLQEIINMGISNTFGPPAVLINSKEEIIHIKGDINKYFELREGDTGLRILDLARHEIRSTIQVIIHKAKREKQTVISHRNRIKIDDHTDVYVDVYAQPLDFEGIEAGLMLVAFVECQAQNIRQQEADINIDNLREQRIVDLEQELAAVYERLQTTVEELETSNEELQSLNEELQSSNEELQSTNEEFETSNEELQTTNEELSTVNQELQVKSQELSEAHTNLENIFRRIDIPLIVVDRDLRVRCFTPTIGLLFNIMPGDTGQVLTNIGTYITIPNFKKLVESVLETGESKIQIINAESKVYELKIYPYFLENRSIDGALITFYDITISQRRKQEFEALAENAPDIVVRFDTHLRHLYVNKSVEKYTGKSKEDFIGKTNHELGMPKDLVSFWEKEMKQVIESRREHSFEFEFDSLMGKVYFESRVVPEFSVDGRVISLLVISRNITVMKQYMQKFDNILESITDGFFSLDEDLRVTYFNKAAGELLHAEPEKVVGNKLFEVFPEAVGSIFEQQYTNALRTKKKTTFETFFDKGHYTNWYTVRVYPKKEGISVYFQVITAQKKAEIEIKHQKNIFKAIFDNVPIFLLLNEQNSGLFIVNKAFEDTIGWKQDELSFDELLKKCYPDPGYREQVTKYMSAPSNDWKEFNLTTKKGDNLDTRWANLELEDGTFISIGFDVTETNKIEKILRERQKFDSLGTLAGGIAHEFNNMLTVMTNACELIHEDCQDEKEVRQFSDIALKAAIRAKSLTNQILTFSRQSGAEKKNIHLQSTIHESLQLLRTTIPKSIRIDEEFETAKYCIFANETQVNQIVMNLGMNAVHAINEKGTIKVSLKTIAVDDKDTFLGKILLPGKYFMLTFSDNGRGIETDVMDRIFDPFYTTKNIGEGSGMGLSVVRGIVEDHGGKIQVESAIGKGTTFTIYLPLIEEGDISIKDMEAEEIPIGKETILLVDDEEMLIKMTSEILIRLGYQVVSEKDGKAAFKTFRRDPDKFALVITDQAMPNMSGHELAVEILKIKPSIPIILCTGHSNKISQEKALEMGIRKYLNKPIRRNILATAIRDALDSK